MRHISRLKRIFWYSTVTLLVTLAVLVTVARLTISSVSEYRTRLEELAGNYLGQPVTIEDMDARLVGLRPSVLLLNVSLREKETREQLAHFDQIGIVLNPLSSLSRLSPVVTLTIKGARIVVIQNSDGSFRLQGVTLSKQAKDSGRGGALGAWFLSQARLALEDSTVRWRNMNSGKEVTFAGVNVELQNLQQRHRLNASVKLPGELGKEMRLALDIHGDLLNRRDWMGDLYIKTARVKPAQWLAGFDYGGLQMEKGAVDLELWSHWEGGSLQSLEGAFDLSALALKREQKRVPITALSGQLQFLRDPQGWQLALQKAVVQGGSETPQPFRLQLQQRDGVTSLRASSLNIRNLMRFSDQLPGLLAAQRQQLVAMAPAGQVESLRIDMQAGRLLGAVATVKDGQVKPWKALPGVSGLDGSLRFDGRNAELRLDSEKLTVDLPNLFEHPLHLQQVKGSVKADRTGQGWRLFSEQLAVANRDLNARVALDLQIQPDQPPLISLLGRVHDGRVQAVPNYLPVKIMPEDSYRWLSRAFGKGRIERGSVLMHGRLEKSLMHDEQGRFEVRFDARDVAIDYKDGWPPIESIRGEARFTGTGMVVNARSGRIFSSPLSPTTVRIENFSHAVLEVDGAVQASAADALRFLRESPLVPGNGLESMQAEGMTPIRLNMTIPLSEKVRQGTPLQLNGKVIFTGNRLQVAQGVELQEVQGDLDFTEKRFEAGEINASLFGAPTRLTVFTEEPAGGERGATVVAARGHVDAESIRKIVPSPLLANISGDSDWQGRLSITPGETGGVDLKVHSGLQGVAVGLPAPMGKEESEKRDLDLVLGLAGHRHGIYQLRYGDLLALHWRHGGDDNAMQRISVRLGAGDTPPLPEQDLIQVVGSLRQFDWRPWVELAGSLKQGESRAEPLPVRVRMQQLELVGGDDKSTMTGSESLNLPAIDLSVQQLAYAGYQLGDVTFQVKPKGSTVTVDNLSVKAATFNLSGGGQWRKSGTTRFKFDYSSDNLGRMLREFGFASVIKKGKARASGKVSWPGRPMDFSLANLDASGHVVIKDGTIEEVEPGAGKLLGLLSLQALPRRLFLDFSDLSKKGLQFQSIEGDIEISDGNAVTDNMVMKSLPADILVTGRTGLVRRDFDQMVMVVPNVSDTVSVAGGLAWGPQVAAALLVLQKLFKSDIDAATMTRYKITGTWEKPEITRLEPLPPKVEQDDPLQVQ